MYNFFLNTNGALTSFSVFLLRGITGLIVFVAGAGKVLGWFGGFGLKKTLEAFSTMMHINSFWAYVSSYTEFIGGLLLMIGFLTRPAALFVAINMFVATTYVGWDKFFTGNGDFPFILFICSLAILFMGPKVISLDALFFRKVVKKAPTYR